jgi:hypothetical protein
MNGARSSLVLALLTVVLGWRLVASLAGAASEFDGADQFGRKFGQRLAAIDEPLAARRHRSLGFADEIFEAVVAQVPPDALLLIDCAPTSRNEKLVMAGLDLLWPRRILLPGSTEAEAAADVAGKRDRLYALTLANEKVEDASRWKRLAGNARFTLWRATEPPR